MAFGYTHANEFRSMLQKVRERVQQWSTQYLSQGGKEVLIKACVKPIPVFTMSCFLLPKKVVNELDSSGLLVG